MHGPSAGEKEGRAEQIERHFEVQVAANEILFDGFQQQGLAPGAARELKALLEDPFGHKWRVASRREELSADEMQRRWDSSVA